MSSSDDSSAVAIVSDGCSSGGMTDVGARIVAHSTDKAIRIAEDCVDPDLFNSTVENYRKTIMLDNMQVMGLEQNDMLATCSYLTAADSFFSLSLSGDGVVVEKQKNGKLIMAQVSWDKNAPYYPAYSDSSLESFKEFHDENPLPCNVENWLYEDSFFRKLKDENISTEKAINGYFAGVSNFQEIEMMAVFSDGITQIDGLDWKDAVVQAMSFKTTKGAFLKRRMMRMIKDSQKNGRGPIDDIAGAIIRCE